MIKKIAKIRQIAPTELVEISYNKVIINLSGNLKGHKMQALEMQNSWLGSEQSFGVKNDQILLEIRHRILTGIYKPMQQIVPNKIAAANKISIKSANKIINSLADYGYIKNAENKLQIQSWSKNELSDVLAMMKDFIIIAAKKNCDRANDDVIENLKNLIKLDDINLTSKNTLEKLYMRLWMFWHTILQAIAIPEYRQVMLNVAPPILRRRMVISMNGPQINSMFSDFKAIAFAIEQKDKNEIVALINKQWEQILPNVISDNNQFLQLNNDQEIDYTDHSLPSWPIFRREGDDRCKFIVGFREPTSWNEFNDKMAKLVS
jgi:DNA-binding GntR family transcriptional regulator